MNAVARARPIASGKLVKKWRAEDWPGRHRAVTRTLLEHWARGRPPRAAVSSVRSRRWEYAQSSSPRCQTDEVRAGTDREGSEGKDRRGRGRTCSGSPARWRPAAARTVVMSMLIAWQVLNKRRKNPRDNRFTDAFLVVTPGITIRDRLPRAAPGGREQLLQGTRLRPERVTRPDLNTARDRRHQFPRPRFSSAEKGDAGGLTKRVLTANTPRRVHRVARGDGQPWSATTSASSREIMVINDEAHHCYRGKAGRRQGEMTRGGRRGEAKVARRGGPAVDHRAGGGPQEGSASRPSSPVRHAVLPEGVRLPGGDACSRGVVSDFSLMDAIECGIVKVPRVPIADKRDDRRLPEVTATCGWTSAKRFLDIRQRAGGRAPPAPASWVAGRRAEEPVNGHYARKFAEWEADEESRANGSRRPCSSSSATTPTSARPSSTTSAGTKPNTSTPTASRSSPPGALTLVRQHQGQPLAAPAEHDPRR